MAVFNPMLSRSSTINYPVAAQSANAQTLSFPPESEDKLSIHTSSKGLVKDNSFNHPDLEMRVKPNGERGVFAKGPIHKGEIATIFTGDFVSGQELATLPEETKRQSLQMADNIFQIASKNPNDISQHLDLAEYYNHSCDPNTYLVGNNVLIAAREIKPGEELTFDYGTTDGPGNPDRGWQCDCGAANCRQFTTPDDYKFLAPKYGPEHIAEYLKRQYLSENSQAGQQQVTSPFATALPFTPTAFPQ